MNYTEAVKHLEEFYQLQDEKCDKCEAALAVLRRAEPVMAAVEGAGIPDKSMAGFIARHPSGDHFMWETDEDDILRTALAFKESQ